MAKMTKRGRRSALLELARERHGTSELEFDELTSEKDLSFGVDGVWVRAWAFIPNEVLHENKIENPEGD